MIEIVTDSQHCVQLLPMLLPWASGGLPSWTLRRYHWSMASGSLRGTKGGSCQRLALPNFSGEPSQLLTCPSSALCRSIRCGGTSSQCRERTSLRQHTAQPSCASRLSRGAGEGDSCFTCLAPAQVAQELMSGVALHPALSAVVSLPWLSVGELMDFHEVVAFARYRPNWVAAPVETTVRQQFSLGRPSTGVPRSSTSVRERASPGGMDCRSMAHCGW